jgi:hypothetical protein
MHVHRHTHTHTHTHTYIYVYICMYDKIVKMLCDFKAMKFANQTPCALTAHSTNFADRSSVKTKSVSDVRY